ncbi:MAG: carboxypeptidase-like regulatory domain-containing protein, partial [Bacteroidales bacterium]|nr:carboxypeptidase-like regulatory domain-containing protein [Bacteroidales bacterium]
MLKLLSSKLAAIVAIFAMTVLAANAQNKAISGTVVDTAGEPVIGASVFVVGNTSIGAMTDLDGKFTLNVPA